MEEALVKKLFITAICILVSLFVVVPKSSAEFYDVTKKNANYEAVNWAVDLGIVKGYEDGTFKPNNVLTEAQFMRMFARYINPVVESEARDKTGLDTVYDFLKKHNVVVAGTNNLKLRNQQFTRLDVAKVFASYQLGKRSVTAKEAIDWMYKNKVTFGKGINNDKYKDFGSSDVLKRVHAVAFINRLFDYDVIDVAKYTREVYTAAKDEAPFGYSLVSLESVNLVKDAYTDNKTTYFASYLEPGNGALPYYKLLEYDKETDEWSTPIVKYIEGYHYTKLHKVNLVDSTSIANEQLLLVNWEGTGGFIIVNVLGIDEAGNYSWVEAGGYANGDYKVNGQTITLYEDSVPMEILTWGNGEFVEAE